ncbi:MAG: argininosuccinate lyase [Actinobacteria bacterium]|nr:argininosuccinate lyase [Actinomycetota bacterium]
MNKIWSGRVGSNTDNLADKFTFSLKTDVKLYVYDIIGTIAYAAGLKKIGIISKSELIQIIDGLIKIKNNIEAGRYPENDYNYEDIHSLIEFELKNEIGEAAGKIHTGRSRNDQIVLDEKLYLKDAVIQILKSLAELQSGILEFAQKNITVIFPAYTHLQKAQPVLFSHYLLSFFEKFSRDINKLFNNFNESDLMPLGSGACTGSGYAIDRKYLSKLLKFKGTACNSMDEVSNRDYFQDFIYNLSCVMLHLSRFCEDLIIYNSNEFSYIEIADEFCTGSSIMPQKKNPDILELIRGKSSIVAGNLVQFEVMQKGLPTTYNRDFQEDKGIVFNAFNETLSSVIIFKELLKNIKLNEDKINKSMERGFTEATDIADYLAKKGETFRNSHNITGKIIRFCIENDISLKDLDLKTLKNHSQYFDSDFFEKISLGSCINAKITDCGTNSKSVNNNLKTAFLRMQDIQKEIEKLKSRVPDINSLMEEIKNTPD